LAAIGIPWRDKKRAGWIARHVGREVAEAAYRQFLDLAGKPPGGNEVVESLRAEESALVKLVEVRRRELAFAELKLARVRDRLREALDRKS
jgi:hypothetical protein